MRRLSDKSQIVATRGMDHHRTCEIFATEAAEYDEATSTLVLTLDSCVRRSNPHGVEDELHPEWLPRRDVSHHVMSLDEAFEESAEAFQRWAGKVRASIPPSQMLVETIGTER